MDAILSPPKKRQHVSLRGRILITILLLLILALILFYGFSRLIVLRSFEDLEQDTTRRDVQRALYALENDLAGLTTTAADWAQWDDTYTFVQDGNAAYIESNLTPSTFETLTLNLVVLINQDGDIVYGQGYDLAAGEIVALRPEFQAQLTPGSLLLTHPDTASKTTGVILLPEGPMLVASLPILTSLDEGPIQGTLIFGRYLDRAEIARLAHFTYLSIELRQFDEADLPSDFKTAQAALSGDSRTYVSNLSKQTIAGYALVDDIYGQPSLILRVELPRSIHQRGQDTVGYFALLIAVLGLAFAGASGVILERWMLARLKRLTDNVQRVGERHDFTGRV
ncbi:MAG: hypothetical protein JW910_05410, partial [Anaerolineae bacterium]|nr:hypothetical protein [Anaerolineae bacterium]